jgi:hypothetical protein
LSELAVTWVETDDGDLQVGAGEPRIVQFSHFSVKECLAPLLQVEKSPFIVSIWSLLVRSCHKLAQAFCYK